MFSAVIVGDDEEFLSQFVEVVQEASSALSMNLQVVPFSWPCRLLQENRNYDVYFLDVEMKSVPCLELAQRLRDIYISGEFVFVGKYEQHIRSFLRVKPIGFIRKGCLEEDVQETVAMLGQLLAERDTYVLLENNTRQERVNLEEIAYIQSKEHYVYLHDCAGGTKILRSKLGDVESRIQNCDFLRVHHSYLINLRWLQEYNGNKVIMKNGECISISDKYREKARPILKNWMERD